SKSCKWLPGKSGKSPAAGASAVYLWRFDGRWKNQFVPTIRGGQHVFCLAKNGQQAGLVWNHASTTVDCSPYLTDELNRKIIRRDMNKSLLRYMPKNSRLTIIAGDSQRAYDAAEGKNANGIQADEAHVIDNCLVTATRKAGKSNESFLWNQNSTYGAGDGYGKNNLEYGKKVASGEAKNDAFFFRTYAAPEGCSDAECGSEEIWRQANPNYGFTVTKRSMLDEYNEVKGDPFLFAGFKQRALNIWNTAINPMLSADKWEACAEVINWETIRGVGGGLAFDLATTGDFASVAISWDEGGKLNCWAKVWTCEEWIAANGWRGDFLQWQKDGHLLVSEGGAIDIDEEIPEEVIKIIKHCGTAALGYDEKYGTPLAQRLLKKFPRLNQGKLNQSVASYSLGTTEFRNAVKNGTLRHPNNPCINWQAGHVQAKEMGEYLKPVKPQSDGSDITWAKVDTIQAICMATTVKSLFPHVPFKPRAGWV
ncbi:MAG TPA: terminase TerL endonuclease subunit, partial [Pirellulales bacterium]|nr:terminase TerL endonuclease subunit [Pirellulales bacterium]